MSHGRCGAQRRNGRRPSPDDSILGAYDMTAVITIAATAAATFIAHLVYGAVLAGREYDRSEQAWTNAADRLIPKHVPAARRVRLAKPRLQRA